MERGPMALFGAVVAVGLGPALWLGAQLSVVNTVPPARPITTNEQRVGIGGSPVTAPTTQNGGIGGGDVPTPQPSAPAGSVLDPYPVVTAPLPASHSSPSPSTTRPGGSGTVGPSPDDGWTDPAVPPSPPPVESSGVPSGGGSSADPGTGTPSATPSTGGDQDGKDPTPGTGGGADDGIANGGSLDLTVSIADVPGHS